MDNNNGGTAIHCGRVLSGSTKETKPVDILLNKYSFPKNPAEYDYMEDTDRSPMDGRDDSA